MNLSSKINSFGDCESNRVVWPEVHIENNRYGRYREENGTRIFEPLGQCVSLKKVYRDIDSGEHTLVLESVGIGGDMIEIMFPRAQMNERDILSLKKFGIQVNKYTCDALMKSIENQEPFVETQYVHKTLGFSLHNGKPIFKYYKCLGANSKYIGPLNVKGEGDFTTWVHGITDRAIGHTPLELVIAVAAAAPIIDFISLYEDCGTLLCSLVSDSTSGKTSSAFVAVSQGSAGKFGKGMAYQFLDTDNAIMSSIVRGFPTLIDEASLKKRNYTELIYSLARGQEKRRKTDSKEEPRTEFHTSIITTSEVSILDNCDENNGLAVRLIEITLPNFMPNAKTADKLMELIAHNYGHCTVRIAQELIKDGIENVMNGLDEYTRIVLDAIESKGKKNKFATRIAKDFAKILLGADYFYKVTKRELDEEAILDLLIEQHKLLGENSSIGKRARKAVMEYVETNGHLFTEAKSAYSTVTQWGCISDVKETLLSDGKIATKALCIAKMRLHQILQEAGFREPKVVLSSMREEGILKCESDRFVEDIMIGGKRVSGYKILLEEQEDVCDTVNSQEERGKTMHTDIGSMFQVVESNIFDDDEDDIDFEDSDDFEEHQEKKEKIRIPVPCKKKKVPPKPRIKKPVLKLKVQQNEVNESIDFESEDE